MWLVTFCSVPFTVRCFIFWLKPCILDKCYHFVRMSTPSLPLHHAFQGMWLDTLYFSDVKKITWQKQSLTNHLLCLVVLLYIAVICLIVYSYSFDICSDSFVPFALFIKFLIKLGNYSRKIGIKKGLADKTWSDAMFQLCAKFQLEFFAIITGIIIVCWQENCWP